MIIDTNSEEMFWILCKVNKDMLDFLCDQDSLIVLQTKRGDWIKSWQKTWLSDKNLHSWMAEGKLPGYIQ